MNWADDEPQYDEVPRSLQDRVYAVRWRFGQLGTVRLGMADLMASVGVPMLLWQVMYFAGRAHQPMPVVRLPFDPFGWVGLMCAMMAGFSILNKLRPNDSIWEVFKGWLTPKRFSPHLLRGDDAHRVGEASRYFREERRPWTSQH